MMSDNHSACFLPGWALVTIPLLCQLFLGCGGENSSNEPDVRLSGGEPVYDGAIVAFGDSLTAGLGLAEDRAYPALLEKKLLSDGFNYRVINAGISGETSSGALSRIKWVISALKPDIIILETGANDGMRGISPGILRDNLDQILSIIKENNIKVILAGMKMLPNLGPIYGASFESVYTQMARKHEVPFIPFFLEGVAGDDRLNREDGIHPNEEGYARIVENIYPYVLNSFNKNYSSTVKYNFRIE
jgi:acyl-CoA thioesterase-1